MLWCLLDLTKNINGCRDYEDPKEASLREAAQTEIHHQQWHIYDDPSNIKALFRSAFVLHDPGSVHQRDLQSWLCMLVCGPRVWVMPAAQTTDQSVFRTGADQLRPPSVCRSCELLPAPRTAPPGEALHKAGGGETCAGVEQIPAKPL